MFVTTSSIGNVANDSLQRLLLAKQQDRIQLITFWDYLSTVKQSHKYLDQIVPKSNSFNSHYNKAVSKRKFSSLTK